MPSENPVSVSNHSQKQINAPSVALPVQGNQTLCHHSTCIISGHPLTFMLDANSPAQCFDVFSYCHVISHAKQYFYLRCFFTVLAYLSTSSGLTLKFNKYSLRGEKPYVFKFRREHTRPGTHITDDRQLKNMHHASFHAILGTSFLHFQRRNRHV